MERVVRDPSNTGPSIQRFAEACQDSGSNQLHLYLIAHRTLDSYVGRMKEELHLTPSRFEEWQQDFKKVEGRFSEFHQESGQEELFGLLDDVLIQRREEWDEFVRQHENEFALLTDEAFKAELFPELSSKRLKSLIIEGAHPLHPITAAFLPRVARIVAQNQRTLFTFLCGNHPGTVAEFLRHTPVPSAGEPLRLVPPESLWTYFEEAIRRDRLGQQAYRLWRGAMSGIPTDASYDRELAERLLRVLGLFELLRIGDPERAQELRATIEMLSFALDLHSDEERKNLKEILKWADSNRVIGRRRDGVYQMLSGGTIDLDERIARILEERRASIKVAEFIRDRWGSVARGDKEIEVHLDLTK
ncbi:MAG: hypothetical protein ACUVX8_04495 [Candidatus Zipacnadales bacterium]